MALWPDHFYSCQFHHLVVSSLWIFLNLKNSLPLYVDIFIKFIFKTKITEAKSRWWVWRENFKMGKVLHRIQWPLLFVHSNKKKKTSKETVKSWLGHQLLLSHKFNKIHDREYFFQINKNKNAKGYKTLEWLLPQQVLLPSLILLDAHPELVPSSVVRVGKNFNTLNGHFLRAI